MDIFISVVQENWDIVTGPTDLAAFALWKLNWIHPFVEGNGRTARAACYYLLCLRYGDLLPGNKIVPERIRENREPYYAALRSADTAYNDIGQYDVSELSIYLRRLMEHQLAEI
jgi:Fic family protein